MATLAGQLKAGGIFLTAPLTNVTYKTVGPNKAKNVIANPLSSVAGNTTGSKTGSSDPPGWLTVENGGITSPSSYVRMHLLYHMLHGPGVAWNLVPAPQSSTSGLSIARSKLRLKQQSRLALRLTSQRKPTTPNRGRSSIFLRV